MGRSHEEMGVYFMLMAMYWENDCRLPSRERLAEALRLRGKKLAVLDKVIDLFFPDGVNEQLELCKTNALETSRRNSANARKGHAQREKSQETPENSPKRDSDDVDF